MAHFHHHLIPLYFLVLFTPLLGLGAQAQHLKALVAPITQTPGASSSAFTITLNQNQNLVIDIESPFSWQHCPKAGSPRVPCRAPQCTSAQQSNKSPTCRRLPTRPRNPPNRPCTCSTTPFNPFTKTCALSQLTYSSVSLPSTNGHNPLANVKYNKIYTSCAPKLLFNSLPNNSSGIASLSRGSLSLVSQFSNAKVSKIFGMCLGEQGVAFFGEGPYYLLPPPGRGVTQLLSYTPLLKNPKDALGYYIGLKGISVGLQAVKLPTNTFAFDSLGNGGVKLSTVTPYTTMKSSIYRAFFSLFSRSTSKYPRVAKVTPFDLCFNSTKLGSTRVGLPVPQIDLQLSSGGNWTIFGANSMVQVSDEVACLGFVDGGATAKQDVVIGWSQMKHNFLQFDQVKTRLGFSSSLFFFQTTCSNFNFTSGV